MSETDFDLSDPTFPTETRQYLLSLSKQNTSERFARLIDSFPKLPLSK